MAVKAKKHLGQNFLKSGKALRDIILAAKISEKTTFSKQILPQLKEINTKVLRVRDKFNELNRRLSDLEKQIKEKDSGIADAGTACAGLQEEIQRLKTELASSQQQQRDLEQTYNTRFQELTEEKDKMRSEQVNNLAQLQLASQRAKIPKE